MALKAPAFNAMIGVWLLIASLWLPHTRAQSVAGLTLGLFVTLIASVASLFPPARWLNAPCGALLLVSTVIGERAGSISYWSDLACAVAIVVLSCLPRGGDDSLFRHASHARRA